MPDVREVFQMSTQKVDPEPGFVERQYDHRRKHERNRKLGAFVVVAVLGAAAALLIFTTRPDTGSTGPANDQTSIAPLPVPPGFTATIVDLKTGEEAPLDGLTGGAKYIASPDGSQVAYGTCCSPPDVISLGNIDGTGDRQIAPPTGFDAYGQYFSPDGTQLLYQQRPAGKIRFGSLIVQDLRSGETTTIATLDGRDPLWYLAPSYSPDGRTVVFHMPRETGPGWDVWSVPATGGEPTKLLENAGFPRYLPDGEGIVFVAGMTKDLEGQRIMIAEPDGSRRTLASGVSSTAWPAVSPDGTQVAFTDGGTIVVVDIVTGETRKVSGGRSAEWIDDGTLLVAPQ